MNIVLFQPEIPQNTGNILRTCAAIGASLSLIRPIAFSISDRQMKRAGLDYWDSVPFHVFDSFDDFLEKEVLCSERRLFFFSSHSKKSYHEIAYQSDDFLIFGSETKGLCPSFLKRWPEAFYTIPMKDPCRCLNLSNAVAIVSYEARRQAHFA